MIDEQSFSCVKNRIFISIKRGRIMTRPTRFISSKRRSYSLHVAKLLGESGVVAGIASSARSFHIFRRLNCLISRFVQSGSRMNCPDSRCNHSGSHCNQGGSSVNRPDSRLEQSISRCKQPVLSVNQSKRSMNRVI